jgi:hypothetical protein
MHATSFAWCFTTSSSEDSDAVPHVPQRLEDGAPQDLADVVFCRHLDVAPELA